MKGFSEKALSILCEKDSQSRNICFCFYGGFGDYCLGIKDEISIEEIAREVLGKNIMNGNGITDTCIAVKFQGKTILSNSANTDTIEMTWQELYHKTSEAIAKFKNGREMYNKSPLFHKIVQMMARGSSETDIIELLITMQEDSAEQFKQYMHRDTRPITQN